MSQYEVVVHISALVTVTAYSEMEAKDVAFDVVNDSISIDAVVNDITTLDAVEIDDEEESHDE